ncbi:MAG: ABC transporter permease [Phycisphaerales bacterium]
MPLPRFAPILARLAPVLALAALVLSTVLFEQVFREPDQRAFLKPENLLNILRQAAPVGVIAVGMTFVIISGAIDLSVGALTALAAGLGIMTLDALIRRDYAPGTSIGAALAVMLLAGAAGGAVNGTLVWLGRIPPFIATLGTLAAYRSLAVALADGGNFEPDFTYRSKVAALGELSFRGIPLGSIDGRLVILSYPVLIFAAVAAAGAFLLRRTVYGVQVRATGDNERAAAYAAIRTGPVRLIAFALAGLTTGIAALLYSARMGASVPSSTTGLFTELDAIAAVVIGGTQMRGGSGTVLGTVVGVLVLAVITNMLSMVGVGGHYQDLVKGGVIIAAALLQRAVARQP